MAAPSALRAKLIHRVLWVLLRPEAKSQFLSGSANTLVQTQEVYSGNRRTHGQCRCQVKRIERPDGLSGKRLPRALHNFCTDSPYVPVPSRSIQVGSPVRGRTFIDFSDPDRTN